MKRLIIPLLFFFLISSLGFAQRKAKLKDLIKTSTKLDNDKDLWVWYKPKPFEYASYLNFESLNENLRNPKDLSLEELKKEHSFPIESILSEADLDYMLSQSYTSSIKNWTKLSIKGLDVKVLKEKVQLPPFRNPQGIRKYYRYSRPLYSLDGNIAIYYVEKFCGMDCGGGQLNIIKRIGKSSWEWVAVIGLWIS